jgi:hypothetical protein
MIMHVLLLVLMTFVIATTEVGAQQRSVTISGRIAEDSTLRPLGFARVRDLSAKNSVLADKYGRFSLRITPVTTDSSTIVITLLGYGTDTIRVAMRDTTIVVSLVPRTMRTSEVVVSAEDPARQIMRQVLARKRDQESRLQSYTYMLYTKFIATTDTTTALRSTGRGDSTIVSILESFSKGYFKQKDNYYNEIIQRRQTANVPSQANTVTFGTNLNAFEDVVTILGEEIDSPFASDALDVYDFTLRTRDDDDTVKLEVHPKSPLRRAFDGYVYIDQQTHTPVEVQLIPTPSVNLPFDAQLTYRQTFQLQDSMVVPEALSIESTLEASLFWIISPRLDIDIDTYCYDYQINPGIPDYLFDQKRVEILPEATVFDSSYWSVNTKLPLQPEEELAYQEINTFVNNPDSLESSLLNRFFAPIRRGLAALRRPPFTGFDDIMRYNSIHGLYLGVGLSHRIEGVFDTKLTGGYGFSDNHWYYTGSISLPFDAREKLRLSVSHGRELIRRDNPNLVRQNLIAVTTLLFGNDYGDYYYSTGSTLGLSYSWGQLRFLGQDQFIRPSSFVLRYRSSDDRSAESSLSYFHFLPRRGSQRLNPSIAEGRYVSLSGELSLDYFPFRRVSRSGLNVSIETADAGILGGDHSFSLLNWQGFVRTATLPLWTLDVSISGSWSWGAVPPQRFMSTESGLNGIAVGNAFRGMSVKEFYGDRSFVMTMSHNFGEVIPGVLRVPNIASFGLEFIVFGGFAWTSFSDATRERYKPLLQSTVATADRFYYDAGLSINRLLIFLRLDINARLSQRDKPEFRITIGNALF